MTGTPRIHWYLDVWSYFPGEKKKTNLGETTRLSRVIVPNLPGRCWVQTCGLAGLRQRAALVVDASCVCARVTKWVEGCGAMVDGGLRLTSAWVEVSP